jgi:hypothetical protein
MISSVIHENDLGPISPPSKKTHAQLVIITPEANCRVRPL